MTDSAPPSPRSSREWGIAIAQSLLSGAIGMLILLVVFGVVLEEFADQPPPLLVVIVVVDALIGAVLSLVIGPLRFLRPGPLSTAIHLVIIAVAGLSAWTIPAAGIALLRVGRRRRLVLDVAAVGLLVGVSCLALVMDSEVRGGEIGLGVFAGAVIFAVIAVIPLLIGRVLATRKDLVVTLRDRAARADEARASAEGERSAVAREAQALRKEHDAEVARVRAEERAALARDMHDSLSHHLAVIAMHAGAMTYREDLSREEVRDAAGTVRDAAHQANSELREVLLALRTSESSDPLATVPTLAEIVDRARDSGQDVSLAWENLTPTELGGRGRGTVVALARILAEAVANSAKHAPGQSVQATLARREHRIMLTVSNAAPTGAGANTSDGLPSTGHGLIGVQERARLLGGDSRHGRHGERFEVEAWVPW